ncbi:hypothetical protein WMY93_021651 [Mugilogobius chulae]|uniref:VWFD domain-containing protein n=1 Tax=Mugilogobius chulae TaxID=88201 RepID=A0AAW0NH28_9GOBI
MNCTWPLGLGFFMILVLEINGLTLMESKTYTCKTFGSGVVQPFNGTLFHVHSDCPFTLTRFTHNRVECAITTWRGHNGLLERVEITINKIRTVLQNGSVQVEATKRVGLPYDHTYQHIFPFGINTKLRSAVLPLSVVWHNAPGGIDTLWIELEQQLSTEMDGLCGNQLKPVNKENIKELISGSVLPEETCKMWDPASTVNNNVFSYILDCLDNILLDFMSLCEENIYHFEESQAVRCSFFKEVVQQCGSSSHVWSIWREITHCGGPAFVPSCSNPNIDSYELTSTCFCPNGLVLDDHHEGSHCASASTCSCLAGDRLYKPGEIRTNKRETCSCVDGDWECTPLYIPPVCVIEGQFVTTFDGKLYTVGYGCSYVAAQDLDWKIVIDYPKEESFITSVRLEIFEDKYSFADNMVTFADTEITDLHESEHALVFWQSSMFVEVYTMFGLKLQIQMSPEIQIYISPPSSYNFTISGLCGNNNGDTTDDFKTSSGIIENSPQQFAQSWSIGPCNREPPPLCLRTDYELFADEKCSVLTNPTGIFAACHGHVSTDHYLPACVQRTCSCPFHLHQCLCSALSSYVKACTSLGLELGDWRKATNCTVECPGNQEFSYNIVACNSTCRSLSGPDLCCLLEDVPVEGCGCPEGTHLTKERTCSPKSQCECHYNGGTTAPGPAVIDGRQCLCEDGELKCSDDCGCTNGKVCVHCSHYKVDTFHKTCDSLSKPACVLSGQWLCTNEPCPSKCQVFGNGHYQTFDSKWYRFDGHCQYTLVKDGCGLTKTTFSVRVESVPCCDEALTCSRSIILDIKGHLTLTMSDMCVTEQVHGIWTQDSPLYTVHTVGLYIIITVPSKGITLIWDKHTWITIELQPQWRREVCGLCGNFDSNEMNDLQIKNTSVALSSLVFGNSWKYPSPPCSDVTKEMFPCERHSYCAAWAQRRCRIITGETFKACHLKVDPEPYYQACVQESCSCEFEGKFLGFCTAVAAYAEACSDWDVCVKWRTPDLCPVYCDYYNEQDQCVWHYEACGQLLTCGQEKYFNHKLEGCYPRCAEDKPYYDEHTGKCTGLKNCTCFFNGTVIEPGTEVFIHSKKCSCQNGKMYCSPTTTTSPTTSTATSVISTTETSITTAPPTTTTTATGTTTTAPPTTTPIAITTTLATTTTEPPTTFTTTSASTTISTTEPLTTTASTTMSTPEPTTTTTISTTEPLTTTSTTISTTESPTTTASTTMSTTELPTTTSHQLQLHQPQFNYRVTNYNCINHNVNYRVTNYNCINHNVNYRVTNYNESTKCNYRVTIQRSNNVNYRVTNYNCINHNVNYRVTNYNCINHNFNNRANNYYNDKYTNHYFSYYTFYSYYNI